MQLPPFVCSKIKKLTNANIQGNDVKTSATNYSRTNDTVKVIDRCERKLQLLMGHQALSIHQNKTVSSIGPKNKKR